MDLPEHLCAFWSSYSGGAMEVLSCAGLGLYDGGYVRGSALSCSRGQHV